MGETKPFIPPNLVHLSPPSNSQPEDRKQDEECNLGIGQLARSLSPIRDIDIDPPHFRGRLPESGRFIIDKPDISSLSGEIKSDLTTCRDGMLEFALGIMLGWEEEFGHFRDWGICGGVADGGCESVCVGGSFVVEFNRQRGSGGSDRIWPLHISTISTRGGEGNSRQWHRVALRRRWGSQTYHRH
jgi:hypothetical protein